MAMAVFLISELELSFFVEACMINYNPPRTTTSIHVFIISFNVISHFSLPFSNLAHIKPFVTQLGQVKSNF